MRTNPENADQLRSTLPDEALAAIAWCIEQAEGIMSTTAGAATCDGDPTGALEYVNSMASDIAINLRMLSPSLGGGGK